MKYFLLFSFLFSTADFVVAQSNHLSQLPAGTYDSRIKSSQQKWPVGDISIMSSGRYDVANGESGEYRFSAAAQRVFFTSGTLRGMYATTALVNNNAVIIFPTTESQPMPISGEIWATYRRQ